MKGEGAMFATSTTKSEERKSARAIPKRSAGELGRAGPLKSSEKPHRTDLRTGKEEPSLPRLLSKSELSRTAISVTKGEDTDPAQNKPVAGKLEPSLEYPRTRDDELTSQGLGTGSAKPGCAELRIRRHKPGFV